MSNKQQTTDPVEDLIQETLEEPFEEHETKLVGETAPNGMTWGDYLQTLLDENNAGPVVNTPPMSMLPPRIAAVNDSFNLPMPPGIHDEDINPNAQPMEMHWQTSMPMPTPMSMPPTPTHEYDQAEIPTVQPLTVMSPPIPRNTNFLTLPIRPRGSSQLLAANVQHDNPYIYTGPPVQPILFYPQPSQSLATAFEPFYPSDVGWPSTETSESSEGSRGRTMKRGRGRPRKPSAELKRPRRKPKVAEPAEDPAEDCNDIGSFMDTFWHNDEDDEGSSSGQSSGMAC